MGTYNNGNPQSNAESIGLDDMMFRLKDNLANDISGLDVRWSIFSLWEKIDLLDNVNNAYTYNNLSPSSVSVGGIPVGSTFTSSTLDQIFNKMFYPYQRPILALSVVTNPTRELGSTNVVLMSYNVTKKTDDITSIVINNGVNLYPVLTNTFTSTIPSNVNTAISMVVLSGVGVSDTISTSVTWLNSMYVFGLTFNSIYDLTTNPSDANIIGNYVKSSMTLSNGNIITTDFTNSNVSSSSIPGGTRTQLKTARSGVYTNIGGGNKMIAFAFPTAFGTPTFEVNGLTNTSFTKIVTNHAFRNASGYTASTYDVWVSNIPMNSPLASIKIN
jgi:hypothetical protein